VTEVVTGIRFPALRAHSALRGMIASGVTVVDWLFLFAILLTITSSNYWKEPFGPEVVAAIVATCCLYVAYNAFTYRIRFKNRLLALWSCLGVVYVALSLMRWLPGNPIVFIPDYVLRMGYFTCLVYPATAAFYVFLAKARSADNLRTLAWICVASSVGAMLAYHFFPVYDDSWRVEGQDSGFLSDLMVVLDYGIHNISVLFWWGALLLAIGRPPRMVCALAFMLASASAQMRLLAAMVAIIWIWPRPAKIVLPLSLTIIIGFPIAGALVVWLNTELSVAPDMVGRARWWVDSLYALAQNYGFGYGFGSDSVVDFSAEERFLEIGKWAKLPVMVIHNSFVYVFYSMGVVGGILFILFHVIDLRPKQTDRRDIDQHAGIMFLTACLTTAVNTTLESPNYVLGLCWIYGYLLELNDRVATRPSQQRA
jgi:hypothetical protein